MATQRISTFSTYRFVRGAIQFIRRVAGCVRDGSEGRIEFDGGDMTVLIQSMLQ